jgi:predicted transposase/invertase (TIGR01784 family)
LNQCDATLKLLFQQSEGGALLQLTGVTVERWLNVELPRAQNPRVDLLGETHEGELVHVEFQSSNDRTMAHRMAEYYLAIYRQLNRYPRQTLIFVEIGPPGSRETGVK